MTNKYANVINKHNLHRWSISRELLSIYTTGNRLRKECNILQANLCPPARVQHFIIDYKAW